MTEDNAVQSQSKQSISTQLSKPKEHALADREGLLILMLHGFPGDKAGNNGLFIEAENMLNEKGFHTLRFDFRGCGDSHGESDNFTLASAGEDFRDILGWAKKKAYKRFIVIGEGLGATIGLINQPEDLECTVLLWPILDLPHAANVIFDAAEISRKEQRDEYIERNNIRISTRLIEELKMQDIAFPIRTFKKPMLVMHGSKDAVSPIASLELLRDHTEARRVEITNFQDGVHGLTDPAHRKMMFYHMAQFVEKYS